MEILRPAAEYLPSYVEALRRGWSPDNLRPEAAREELERIAADPVRFLAEQEDREAKGPPVLLPDGSTVPRLPGFRRWMWDGEFCGVIGFRWQHGTPELPPHCLGHIGYAVVPWKRGRGYATRALQLLLQDEVPREGLPYVELTTDVDNLASERVIRANGGELVERFGKPAAYGASEGLRFRIAVRGPGQSVP
jgi:predicted acetyltransferase